MKQRAPIHSHARSRSNNERTQGKSKANPEVRFMTDMIDHHQMAVTMSEKLLKEAEHEELKELCENIITSQRGEIEQMQSWLKDWYGEHTSRKGHATADGSRSKH